MVGTRTATCDVFFVQQTLTRKYHIKEHFYYKFDEEGVPVSCEKPDYQTRNTDDRFLSNKSEAYQISQGDHGGRYRPLRPRRG